MVKIKDVIIASVKTTLEPMEGIFMQRGAHEIYMYVDSIGLYPVSLQPLPRPCLTDMLRHIGTGCQLRRISGLMVSSLPFTTVFYNEHALQNMTKLTPRV